jgi:hypothetical protein
MHFELTLVCKFILQLVLACNEFVPGMHRVAIPRALLYRGNQICRQLTDSKDMHAHITAGLHGLCANAAQGEPHAGAL